MSLTIVQHRKKQCFLFIFGCWFSSAVEKRTQTMLRFSLKRYRLDSMDQCMKHSLIINTRAKLKSCHPLPSSNKIKSLQFVLCTQESLLTSLTSFFPRLSVLCGPIILHPISHAVPISFHILGWLCLAHKQGNTPTVS